MNGTTQSNQAANLWRTPKGDNQLGKSGISLNFLIKEFNLKLDPCATGPEDAMCENYYTEKEDGLTKEWSVPSIFNPPFSEIQKNADGTIIYKKTNPTEPVLKSVIGKWVEKAFTQSQKHHTVIIGILPVYTSTIWYHKFIEGIVSPKFIFGRVRYTSPEGKTGSPNFDTMLVIWDSRK